MESIYLVGSEDVQRAGEAMRNAAAEMTQAANQMWEASIRFERDVDRLEYLQASKEETDDLGREDTSKTRPQL